MSVLQANPPLSDLRSAAARRFELKFGKPPAVICAAPGRVNLIGEHIDYCGGNVLPLAIERYTLVAAAQGNRAGTCRAVSDGQGYRCEFSYENARGPSGAWQNYLHGVANGFQQRGVALPGLDMAIVSSVPSGAGLSSSAALEVATGLAIAELTGHAIAPVELARLAQRAEHDFAGVPCGIMDQFASVLARRDHLLWLDCKTETVRQVPFREPDLALLIIHSGVKHALAGGEYAKRRSVCEQSTAALGFAALADLRESDLPNSLAQLPSAWRPMARHVITENQRAVDAVAAIERRDFACLGDLLFASHASLRDDFAVSCPELDTLVDIAESLRGAGVYGARLTGGGFGGATIWLVASAKADDIAQRVSGEYLHRTGMTARCYLTHPGPGAEQLRTPE
jgi:galactokinase